MRKTEWIKFSVGSLFITMTMGLSLRLIYAGVPIPLLQNLQIKQAHSHLGYYGFLFPMAWYLLHKNGFWTPDGGLAVFYKVATTFACIGFLFSGYGLVSNAGSFMVLIVWLIFAFKNFKISAILRRDWLGSVSASVVISAVFVGLVAISAAKGKSELTHRFVRCFLSMLAYGVFVPVIMERIARLAVPAWIWVFNCLSLSLFVFGGSSFFIFGFGPIAMSLILASSVVAHKKAFSGMRCLRSAAYTLLLAISLILLGTSILPNVHLTAVAGLHFLVLGFILGNSIEFRKARFFYYYDSLVLLMSISLVSLAFWPNYSQQYQSLAAFSGIALIFVCTVLSNFNIYFFLKLTKHYDANHNSQTSNSLTLS